MLREHTQSYNHCQHQQYYSHDTQYGPCLTSGAQECACMRKRNDYVCEVVDREVIKEHKEKEADE